MTLDNEKLLDPTGWQILLELESNARLSFAELGRRGGLSLPAVAERGRRMEGAGVPQPGGGRLRHRENRRYEHSRPRKDPPTIEGPRSDHDLDRALFVCP